MFLDGYFGARQAAEELDFQLRQAVRRENAARGVDSMNDLAGKLLFVARMLGLPEATLADWFPEVSSSQPSEAYSNVASNPAVDQSRKEFLAAKERVQEAARGLREALP